MTTAQPARPRRLFRPAVAGIVATAVALGVSELIAGLLPGATSLVAAIGQWLIDHQPPGAKDLVVALFGTNDKLALEILIVVLALVFGAALGILSARRSWVGPVGFAAFGVLGFLAAAGDPLANAPIVAVQTLVSVGLGIQALATLLGWAARADAAAASGAGRSDPARRSFLLRTGALGIAAVAAGVGGRALIDRLRSAPSGPAPRSRRRPRWPRPLPAGADLSTQIPAITPLVMPNDRFYRIDTALLVPSVDTATWTLRIHGLVDREVTLTWDELLHTPWSSST